LKDKIENYKNFDKPRKTIKKKKRRGAKLLDLMDKIESHKNFNKRAKEKKIKSRRTKSKILYIQIRN